jgi:hypothetical protein
MTGPVDKHWLEHEATASRDDRGLDLDSLPKCPECGYILYKLARMRCPECGTLIQPEDLSPSQTRIEVDRAARGERRWAWVGMGLIAVGLMLILLAAWGYRPAFLCFSLPLATTTVVTILYCLFMGDSVRAALPWLGVLWFLVGGLLAAAVWL